MLNRKGQSLVLFIILIPIMIGIMAFVIDCGNAMIVKNETDNVIQMVLDVSLDKELELQDIKELMDYNLKNNNDVMIKSDSIYIKSSTKSEGIFSKLFGFNFFEIRSEYVGSIQDGKKKIIKRR